VADNHDLPDSFALDAAPAASPHDLPDGFTLDQAPKQSGIDWGIHGSDVSRTLGQLGGAGEAGINALQSVIAAPIQAIAGRVASVIPGADEKKVRQAVQDAIVTHFSDENPDVAHARNDLLGLAGAPVTAAKNITNAGIAQLPAAAQPIAHEAAGAVGDFATLAPIPGAIRSGIADWQAATAADQANKASAEQARANLNAPRDAILAEGREKGLVVPPTAINPSAAATAAESVSGKAATRQAAQATNSQGFNAIAREDLGMSSDAPLTRDALEANIKEAGKISGRVAKSGMVDHADPQFQDDLNHIEQMGPNVEGAYPGIGAQANPAVQQLVASLRTPKSADAGDVLGAFKLLNNQAKDNFSAAFGPNGGNPQALQLARAQRAGADALSDLLQRHLDNGDDPELANDWQQSRVQIAKNYTVLNALKGNNVDGMNLAAQLRKDKPLTGGLNLIANWADQFPEVSAVPKSGAGVSKLAAVVGGSGAGGALLFGHPAVAATAAGATMVPYALRKWMLSDSGQDALATPSYNQKLLDLAQKYTSGRGPVPEPEPFSLAPEGGVAPAAAPVNNSDYAAVLSQGVGEHTAAPELTASTPTAMTARPATRAADFSPALADYLSRGLSLSADRTFGPAQSSADLAAVMSSQVPTDIMTRTPNTAAKLAELQRRYGLTLEEERAPALAEAQAHQALEDQAGHAAGGYISELSLLRHYAQHLR
jgi:hypothetical protein